jgi:hypothetical protein
VNSITYNREQDDDVYPTCQYQIRANQAAALPTDAAAASHRRWAAGLIACSLDITPLKSEYG